MGSTELLVAALAKKRLAREAERQAFILLAMQALDKLAGEMAFESAYIFGSATRPYGFSEGSDLDVAFVGLRDEDFFAAMAFLYNEVGREVDVVQLEGHRLAEKIVGEGIQWRGSREAYPRDAAEFVKKLEQ
ncbi:MAG: hypothetical protein KGZ50_09145 [Peptococcaceae bacterium]|nr:hypothetical protein [Peptococcaceae bacterium]